MAQLDNTGLYQKFGIEQTANSTGGEYREGAGLRTIELVVTLSATAFPFGATNYIINDNVFIPAGVRLQEIETITDTATVGATATFDLGLMRTDRTTVTSATAFLTAVASGVAAGTKVVTTTGGLLGTTTAAVNHVTIRVNTANFTAGVVRFRIRYYRP